MLVGISAPKWPKKWPPKEPSVAGATHWPRVEHGAGAWKVQWPGILFLIACGLHAIRFLTRFRRYYLLEILTTKPVRGPDIYYLFEILRPVRDRASSVTTVLRHYLRRHRTIVPTSTAVL